MLFRSKELVGGTRYLKFNSGYDKMFVLFYEQISKSPRLSVLSIPTDNKKNDDISYENNFISNNNIQNIINNENNEINEITIDDSINLYRILLNE